MKSVGSQTPKYTCVPTAEHSWWGGGSKEHLVRGISGGSAGETEAFSEYVLWLKTREETNLYEIGRIDSSSKVLGTSLWVPTMGTIEQQLVPKAFISQQQDGMNPLPETLKVWYYEPGQAGESEPWDVYEEQWGRTIPRLCGRASHTPWDGQRGRDWAAPEPVQGWEGAAQEHQGHCCPNPTAGAWKTLLTVRTSLPLWISHHLCQSMHLIYCLYDAGARAAAGGCKHCSGPQNPSKVKPCWACIKHSGFPEHSTHLLWAF